MLHSEGRDFDSIKLGCKRQEQPESIPVCLNGMVADPFDMRQILIEELMDAGRQPHFFTLRQREKSTRFLRLMASVTLRYILVHIYSLWPM